MSIHQGQNLIWSGVPVEQAKAAMVMIHGRGATADSILSLDAEFQATEVAYFAPQAAGYTWYPNRFIAPLASNEPYLSSALTAIGEVIQRIETAGLPKEKIVLLGFSQGACLALEYAARNPARYGGVIAYSGGLIGEQGIQWNYSGSLADTPVFLGCSDIDPHIPLWRVQESTQALTALGAQVTEQIYPNMGHTVNPDEIQFTQQLLTALTSQ